MAYDVIFYEKENGVSEIWKLASLCEIPQSSIARIESFQTTPNLSTLLKILNPLSLKLTITK